MLTGVCIDFQKKPWYLCYKCKHIGKIHQEDIKTEDPKQLIMPKKPIMVLTGALSGKDEEVK
jgi:hypothetical protein